MHVDEAQIDGGDTEAVTASIMENPGKRPERGEVEALQTDATSSVRQPRGVNVDEILRELAEIRIGTTGVI